jgi:hypothetical protein
VDERAALQLLSLLQRDGRFLDFVQQDISGFADAQIGQAARLVHDGCSKALARHLSIERVVDGQEGQPTVVEVGFDPRATKLTGNVSGSAPYRGVLRHQGWRAQRLELPQVVADYDFAVLAPAEVEL